MKKDQKTKFVKTPIGEVGWAKSEAASSVRLDGETRDEGDKPEDTERLEVAERIGWCFDDSHMCDPLGCDECIKQAKEAETILSRRDELMKKRGVVDGLKIALAEWNNPEMDEFDVWLSIVISKVEREIREMEGE